MTGPILPISGAAVSNPIRPVGESAAGGAFQEALSTAIQTVESLGRDASASVERFLSGEGEELHTTIMATQRAELAFELFLQARNKVVSAYQEIMRMQM
ncbi:MAG: flagellar hook-basal body complex protein FliE [Bryobacteraceae bacterium]|jgi:flagellar hook-basal body complex protein FliE